MLYRTGLLWLRVGEPARAREVLSRAAALAPGEALIRKSLARAERLVREAEGVAAAGAKPPG
jgi:hypothetical protein